MAHHLRQGANWAAPMAREILAGVAWNSVPEIRAQTCVTRLPSSCPTCIYYQCKSSGVTSVGSVAGSPSRQSSSIPRTHRSKGGNTTRTTRTSCCQGLQAEGCHARGCLGKSGMDRKPLRGTCRSRRSTRRYRRTIGCCPAVRGFRGCRSLRRSSSRAAESRPPSEIERRDGGFPVAP